MHYNRVAGFRDECNEQRHVHEVQGSVEVAGGEPHTHRFAAVTGEALPRGCSHFHEVAFRTDFEEGHFHCFCGDTSEAIPAGNGHIHEVESVTSKNNCHKHRFVTTTFL